VIPPQRMVVWYLHHDDPHSVRIRDPHRYQPPRLSPRLAERYLLDVDRTWGSASRQHPQQRLTAKLSLPKEAAAVARARRQPGGQGNQSAVMQAHLLRQPGAGFLRPPTV
jgi:hypothetical protein